VDEFLRTIAQKCETTQGSAFWGQNNVPLNFGGKTPKTAIFGAYIGLLSLNDKKFKSLET